MLGKAIVALVSTLGGDLRRALSTLSLRALALRSRGRAVEEYIGSEGASLGEWERA